MNMVRMPRVRHALTKDEIDRMVDDMMWQLHFDPLYSLWSVRPNLIRIAVRAALLHWR